MDRNTHEALLELCDELGICRRVAERRNLAGPSVLVNSVGRELPDPVVVRFEQGDFLPFEDVQAHQRVQLIAWAQVIDRDVGRCQHGGNVNQKPPPARQPPPPGRES